MRPVDKALAWITSESSCNLTLKSLHICRNSDVPLIEEYDDISMNISCGRRYQSKNVEELVVKDVVALILSVDGDGGVM